MKNYLLLVVLLFFSTLTCAQTKKQSYITQKDLHYKMQLMGGFGINYNVGGLGQYLGIDGTFSLGSFSNLFNLELSIRPSFQIEEELGSSERYKFLCPIIISPRINLKRAFSSSRAIHGRKASNSFYLYIQPEIGYAIKGSGVYGGRFGLGWEHFGSFFIEGLASMSTLGAETRYSTKFLFLTFGYTFYIW